MSLTLISLAVATLAQGRGQAIEFIRRASFETRLGPVPDSRVWTVSMNGGGIRKLRGLDELTGPDSGLQFPFLITQPEMLPEMGDWLVSVDFFAQEVGKHGVGLALRNTVTGHDLFRVLVDREQGAIQLWGGDGEVEVKEGYFWDLKPVKVKLKSVGTPDRWQVYKCKDRLRMIFDGKTISEVIPEPGAYALRIGSTQNVTYKPADWSRVAFGPIRFDYITALPPLWIR